MANKFWSSTLMGMKTRKLKLIRELNPLDRVYNLALATFYCFGAIVGNHFYLYVADNALDFGPLATSWYIIGGLMSLAFASCYAELASWAPCSGGIYDYCYNTMGELVAFLSGWVLILSLSAKLIFCIRCLTEFIDKNFFDGLMKESLKRNVLIYNFSDSSPFQCFPDLPSIPVGLVVAGLYSTVSRESAISNTVIVMVNMIIICFVLTLFMFFIKLDEMNVDTQINKTTEFIVKGFSAVQHCYSGYELAVFLGEEAINPSVTIPKSVLCATLLGTLCYTVFSFIYILLPKNVTKGSTRDILHIIKKLNLGKELAWLVGLGGICGMTGSTYSAMYSLVRLVYSMSKDGLLFQFLSSVHERTKSPIVPNFTMISIVGTTGIFIKLERIYNLSSFCTALEHLIVCVCLLATRYRCEEYPKLKDFCGRWLLINYPNSIKYPTETTERLSMLLIANATLSIYLSSLFLDLAFNTNDVSFRLGFCFVLIIFLISVILLQQQPRNKRAYLYFRLKGVPHIPMFLIAHSTFMLTAYSCTMWWFTILWVVIGFLFYLGYSRRHSVEFGRVFPHDPDSRWDIMLQSEIINCTPSSSESDENSQQTAYDFFMKEHLI